jgi:tRNA (mo5U34)-methyltransferase
MAFAERHRTSLFDAKGEAVRIGHPDELSPEQHERLVEILRGFAPWRKGPFELFGHRIDANWKSDRKWDRIIRFMEDLSGKSLCDVGCNNGYYMFRASALGPQSVIGFDPARTFKQKFAFLSAFHPLPNLRFVDAGFDRLIDYGGSFDLLLCMGIVYHHRSPFDPIRLSHHALKRGGQFIFESLGVLSTDQRRAEDMRRDVVHSHSVAMAEPDDSVDLYDRGRDGDRAAEELLRESNALFPPGRYAGMTGVWFVPTPGAALHWLRRSGFREVVLESIHEYEEEQVRTPWGDIPGLSECVNSDRTETVEGHPFPVRIILSARK